MKSDTNTIIRALRILARDIQSDDGVANAAITEAADRLQEQQERIKRLDEWIKDLDIIGSHSGKNDMREWNGDIGWLYPGQVAYVGESRP